MTLSTTTNTKTYTGDNSTQAFSFPYLFYANGDLTVTVDGTAQVLDTDYTVSGAGNGAGGTVTFTTAPGTGEAIIIQRIVSYDQQTDFENFDGNPADVTEKQFDLVVMQTQQLAEQTDRTILSPIGTSLTTNEISGTIDGTTRILTITTSGPATATIASISSTLDTILTGEANGDFLQYNGTNWVNITEIGTNDIADAAITFAKFQDVAANSVVCRPNASSGTLDKVALGASELLGRGSTGNLAAITLGTGLSMSGTTLNGSSGGLVLLGSATASNSTSIDIGSGLDLDAAIDGTYDEHLLIISNYVPATDNVNLHLRTSTDGGSTFDSGASDYTYFAMAGNAASATAATSNSAGAAQILLNSASGIGGNTGEASMFEVRISGAATTNDTIFRISSTYVNGAGQAGYYHGTAQRNSAADVDAIRILASTGNITSGTFYLYGIRKS